MSSSLSQYPRIAIILLNWNGRDDTLACLESISKLTWPNFEPIIVDNGSTDDSISWIRTRFPEYLLIETGANLGFAEGNNVGIRAALGRGADLLFLLNNDTVVAKDILERFVETLRTLPLNTGILGAKIFLFGQPDTLDHLGGRWNSKTGTFDLIGHRCKEDPSIHQEPEELDYVCGAGLLLKREVVESIGYLEPSFFLIWEEADYCMRAKKAGYSILSCPNAQLWHKVSASFVGGKPHSTYFWWRNRFLWIERNCTAREKWRLYLQILLPKILHQLKIRTLKKVQLFFTKALRPQLDTREKEQKMLINRAALCGVRDYFFRRFGNGPSWIYRK
jgi:GT2 family glycosyltransferase